MRLDPSAADANASKMVFGGNPATEAFGSPARTRPIGLTPPSSALADSVALLDNARARAAAPSVSPTDNILGYDEEAGTIFSNGRVYSATDNLGLLTAAKDGALDFNNASAPPNFVLRPATPFKQRAQEIPDYQKEFESGWKGYKANMALLGGTITGSQGMKDTYSRLKGESDILRPAPALPQHRSTKPSSARTCWTTSAGWDWGRCRIWPRQWSPVSELARCSRALARPPPRSTPRAPSSRKRSGCSPAMWSTG